MRRLALVGALALIASPVWSAATDAARCEARTVDEAESRRAFEAATEVREALQRSMPQVRMVALPSKREWVLGQCFLTLDLFSDEKTHLSRLITVYLDERFKSAFIAEAEPEPMPADAWWADFKKRQGKPAP